MYEFEYEGGKRASRSERGWQLGESFLKAFEEAGLRVRSGSPDSAPLKIYERVLVEILYTNVAKIIRMKASYFPHFVAKRLWPTIDILDKANEGVQDRLDREVLIAPKHASRSKQLRQAL